MGQIQQGLPQGVGLIGHHPSLGHRLPQGPEHCLQKRAVALPDGTGLPRCSGWHQLVPADQQPDAGLLGNG